MQEADAKRIADHIPWARAKPEKIGNHYAVRVIMVILRIRDMFPQNKRKGPKHNETPL